MSTPARQRVLIAGGGIGGLTTALVLAKHGIGSCVFEQRPTFETEGAGIQIGPNGMRILGDLDVSDHLRPKAAMPQAIAVRKASNGKVLTKLPLGSWIEDRHGAPYWTAHRADLHAALVASTKDAPLIESRLGEAVTDAVPMQDGVEIFLESGVKHTGAALIAADGVWSTARKAISGARAAPPKYVGKSAARAVISSHELPQKVSPTNVTIWLNSNAHVVHYPVNAGAELAMIVVLNDATSQKGWGETVDPVWIDTGTLDFCDDLRSLINCARNWRKWSLFDCDLDATWVDGRMALLGDAAHPVLPFLAQGAVLAMEDATTLAAVIAKDFPDNIDEALANYERLRRPRAQKVQQASRQNGEIYHLSGFMAQSRDLTLRTVPPEHLIARYDWLYSWKSP